MKKTLFKDLNHFQEVRVHIGCSVKTKRHIEITIWLIIKVLTKLKSTILLEAQMRLIDSCN